MQPAAGEADDDVALLDAIGAEDRVLLHATDDEAREVVIRRRVDARHLRRLAADERAAVLAAARGDARDDGLDDRRASSRPAAK